MSNPTYAYSLDETIDTLEALVRNPVLFELDKTQTSLLEEIFKPLSQDKDLRQIINEALYPVVTSVGNLCKLYYPSTEELSLSYGKLVDVLTHPIKLDDELHAELVDIFDLSVSPIIRAIIKDIFKCSQTWTMFEFSYVGEILIISTFGDFRIHQWSIENKKHLDSEGRIKSSYTSVGDEPVETDLKRILKRYVELVYDIPKVDLAVVSNAVISSVFEECDEVIGKYIDNYRV